MKLVSFVLLGIPATFISEKSGRIESGRRGNFLSQRLQAQVLLWDESPNDLAAAGKSLTNNVQTPFTVISFVVEGD